MDLFSEKHTPMIINRNNLSRLFDFIDMFPHFIIGSNSDLPITGGSILDHEHFQGGDHIFPMMKREVKETFKSKKYPNIQIGLLDWYNSTILLRSKNREDILNLTMDIINAWYKYDNLDLDILSNSEGKRHNSITPILRKVGDEYLFYVMLRNNRQDDEYPDGIFHAHPEYHHIKKEGIGLIEAMGLFILPARLKKEFEGIKEYLEGKKSLDVTELSNPDNMLAKHKDMIIELTNTYGFNNSEESAEKAVKSYVNKACEEILECTAVFKNTGIGQAAFDKFMQDGLKLKKV